MTRDQAIKIANACASLYEGAAYDVVCVASAVVATTGEYAAVTLGDDARQSPVIRRFATACKVLAASRNAMRDAQYAGHKRRAEDTLHELKQCGAAMRGALAALVEVGEATKRDSFFCATRDEVTTACEAIERQTKRLGLYLNLVHSTGAAPSRATH